MEGEETMSGRRIKRNLKNRGERMYINIKGDRGQMRVGEEREIVLNSREGAREKRKHREDKKGGEKKEKRL